MERNELGAWMRLDLVQPNEPSVRLDVVLFASDRMSRRGVDEGVLPA
jgi:hypothetical protein